MPNSARYLAAITDLETGGLDEREVNIIEYGVIIVDRVTLEEIRSDAFKVKPVREVDPDAARINGYTPEAWADAMSQREGMLRFRDVVGDVKRFTAWNAHFDRRFLLAAERSTGVTMFLDYHNRDIASVAEELLERRGEFLPKFKLDTTAEYLGLEAEPLPHRALGGARKILEVWRMLREL